MNDAERALRGEIVRTCLAMEARGINQGTSGNVSVRWNDGLLITPSGLAYETMAPEDIIFLELDGTSHGPHAPSSEWRFHRDIMRERTDVQAIVHAHPLYLTGLSILNKDIPAVHYMIAAAGGPSIRCAPYATFGTDELSNNALAALEGRMGCILSNHGVIACGPSLSRALWLAGEMETLAHQYVIALQAGKPVVLSDEEIANVIEKFKSYGPKRKDESRPVAAVAAPVAASVPEAVPEPEPEPAPKPAPVPRKAAAKRASTPSKSAPVKDAKPAAKPAADAPSKAEVKAEASKPAPARKSARTSKVAAPATSEENEGSSPATKAARKKSPARKARAPQKTRA